MQRRIKIELVIVSLLSCAMIAHASTATFKIMVVIPEIVGVNVPAPASSLTEQPPQESHILLNAQTDVLVRSGKKIQFQSFTVH